MSLKDEVAVVEQYVEIGVLKAKAFIAEEVQKAKDALAALAGSGINTDDTAAIGESLARIKTAMDGLAAAEVEDAPVVPVAAAEVEDAPAAPAAPVDAPAV